MSGSSGHPILWVREYQVTGELSVIRMDSRPRSSIIPTGAARSMRGGLELSVSLASPSLVNAPPPPTMRRTPVPWLLGGGSGEIGDKGEEGMRVSRVRFEGKLGKGLAEEGSRKGIGSCSQAFF